MNVLITGGTGSFGTAMVERLLKGDRFERIVVYSRDEFKQNRMIERFRDEFPVGGRLRFFVGDVRDLRNLRRAMYRVDVVIHAAALKQIPSCEYNPWEAVRTNVYGTWNVINAAVECGASKVIALSSDKAVNPVNCYGATKLLMEKLLVNSNTLGKGRTSFSVVRYGNVLASRGSVVQTFRKQFEEYGRLRIMDGRMTRFWWTVEEAVEFTLRAVEEMGGGETFVPKLQSSTVVDLAEAVCPGAPRDEIGVRPGEKIHESLAAPDEVGRTEDLGWAYVVRPDNEFFRYKGKVGKPVPTYFAYTSNHPFFMTKRFEKFEEEE